jgi:hypothetical protein
MNKPIPRIQGRAVPSGSGWSFELYIRIGDSDPLVLGPKYGDTIYLTQTAAINALKTAVVEVSKMICKVMELPEPNEYIDLKAGYIVSEADVLKPSKPGELDG